MAEILTTNISGPDGLPPANPANLSLASHLAVDDNSGTTVDATLGQLFAAAGNQAFDGDVAGLAALMGAAISLTIQPGAVSLSKMTAITGKRLIGNSAAGVATPELISIGLGLSLTGGVLDTTSSAAAPDATDSLLHLLYGTF